MLRCCPVAIRCSDIPLARRVLYAFAVYTGMSKKTLYPCPWENIDFEHGTITYLRTKTGVTRMFFADPSLMLLLKLWHEWCGKPAGNTPVIRNVECDRKVQAKTLHEDLKAAGITRSILSSNATNVQKLRFHDLRGTFVTWARRAGKPDSWISERTGHLTKEMIDRYDRAARTLADPGYEPFPDISSAIPELAALASRLSTPLSTSTSSTPHAPEPTSPFPQQYRECEGGDLNPYANYGASTSS